MTCIIIEDQAPAQRVLKKYISDIGNLNLKGSFFNALAGAEFLKSESVDLLFLDIHLPQISGIDFLKSTVNTPSVILTTAFSEYAVQSYELDVVDYLVKPFSFDRFKLAVSKAHLQYVAPEIMVQKGTTFFLKSGYAFIQLNSYDIYFIQSDNDYTELHLENKKHLSTETLLFWEQKLAQNQFIRVHKSFLVNLEKVEKIEGNMIQLKSHKTIPLGRAYKDAFIKNYIKQW